MKQCFMAHVLSRTSDLLMCLFTQPPRIQNQVCFIKCTKTEHQQMICSFYWKEKIYIISLPGLCFFNKVTCKMYTFFIQLSIYMALIFVCWKRWGHRQVIYWVRSESYQSRMQIYMHILRYLLVSPFSGDCSHRSHSLVCITEAEILS